MKPQQNWASGSGRSAVVLGEESLLIHCAEALRERGIDLVAVGSNSGEIGAWANESGIDLVPNDAQLAEALAGYRFDYLFSITNLRIIADDVLAMAGEVAINFHDGPLPAYAGLHATSWALINGETSHGITWHTMAAGVDEGDIVKQVTFEIAPDETAYTLNVVCYEHAIRSFGDLIDELLDGSDVRLPQDLAGRSYYGRYQRPPAAGTLDWTRSTSETSALARALDFGPHENPLGRAKVLIGDQVYVVASIVESNVVEHDERTEPGNIVAVGDDKVTVAVSDGTVTIGSLIDGALAEVTASAALTQAGLGVGDRLPLLDSENGAALDAATASWARTEAAWVRDLASLEAVELPYARLGHDQDAPNHETVPLELPPSVIGQLDAGDLAAAFVCYLARLTSADTFHVSLGQLSLGADTADAPTPWFAPRVPLRCAVSVDDDLEANLAAVRASLDTTRARGTFASDIGLRYPQLEGRNLGWRGLPLSIGLDVGPGDAAANIEPGLDLVLSIDPATATGTWTRNTNAYPADVYSQIETQYVWFLEQLIADRQAPLSAVSLLAPTERERVVVAWNDTANAVDSSTTLHELFTLQAAHRSDATAVVHGDEALTYAELDERSNQLAHELRDLGAAPGQCVGVYTERGADMIVGLLAILKAGAAYVPLDPSYPADRVAFMIEDSGVAVVLTQSALVDRLPASEAAIVRLDGDAERIAARPPSPVTTTSGPDHLAYLIYTSGSTGKPKGVMVTHRNVVNFLAGMDDHIDHEPGDTWLTVTSLSFDISVLEIFWSLTRGLELIVYADPIGADDPSAAGAPATVDREIGFSLFYFASDESEAGDRQKYELLLEGAKFADANGFEAVWTPERHFHAFGGLYPNPAVTSAAIAAITENVAIRAGSCVVPLHHPARVAEEWAVVDNISRGRVGIGFAAGWQPVDFLLRPETFADRKGELERSVDIVQRLWRGESVSFDGPDGPAEIQTLPRPVQPELPTWLTIAGNPETFAAAGAGGHNVLTHLLGQSVDDVAEKIRIYRKARAEAGHDGPGRVTIMLHTYVGDDLDEVKEVVREPMISYLRSSVSLIKEAAWSFPTFQQKAAETGKSPLDLFESEELTDEELEALLEHAFHRYFEGSALFGTPESCRAMVAQLAAIGVDEIACQVDFGVPSTDVLAHLPHLDQVRRWTEAEAAASTTSLTNTTDERPLDTTIPALIERHGVTHFQCTPSMGSLLIADDDFRRAAAGLKMCLMGGEAFPQSLAKEITDIVSGTVLNVYGPTETTIWSSVHRVHNGDRPVSIGRPLANQQMYVVDANLQPCPIGVPGELLIGGDGVTNGYLDRPELTADRFVDDHFRPDVIGAKLYRTGDLVRFEADGSIDFLGRMDFQVKVRGYRIELGEIEARLNEHPSVREAVVSAREDTPGDQRLVAYAIPDGDNDIDGDALRAHLGQHLPEFMVPSHYVRLDAFPLTPNKKTDRKALPAPDAVTTTSSVTYVAPESGSQQQLVGIWEHLLGRSEIGVNDNFFDLGGHSLLAVQLHRQIKGALDVDLSITDVFRFPTIAALTNHLDHADEAAEAAQSRIADRAAARRQARAGRRVRRRRT